MRDAVTGVIIDSGLKVHRTLGPGLMESAYEHCLAHELSKRNVATRLHEAQLLTDLKLSGIRVGLLMNFNVPLFKNGLKRIVL